jgi:hypothetical protein
MMKRIEKNLKKNVIQVFLKKNVIQVFMTYTLLPKRKEMFMKPYPLMKALMLMSVITTICWSPYVEANPTHTPYLLCNATGWNADASTRLVSTAANVYELEYSVTQLWMVIGNDQCILMVSDSPNGWGTTQEWFGADAFGPPIEAPDTWTFRQGSNTHAGVSYPKLGDYRAVVDMNDMTVTIEAVDGAPEESTSYYYFRSNATGWDANEDNMMILNEATGLLELDYTVFASWMVNYGDQCIVTQTNEMGGWGSSQAFLGVAFGTPILEVPENGSASGTVTARGVNLGVKYPALGEYTATFDPETGELIIGEPVDFPDWGLHGQVEDLGNGRVRVTYDFEDADQLLDWIPANADNSDLTIEDGRLIVTKTVAADIVSSSLLDRGVYVDMMTYDAEIIDSDHINVYMGVVWDDDFNPAIGYGMIHRNDGKLFSDNGLVYELGGDPIEFDHVYHGTIYADPDEISWTVDDETLNFAVDYEYDVTRSIGFGTWSGVVAFDNIVFEGELEPIS